MAGNRQVSQVPLDVGQPGLKLQTFTFFITVNDIGQRLFDIIAIPRRYNLSM